MITSNDISILIVTRVNDSERLKAVYDRIRSYYPMNEIIVIYDDVPHSLGVSDSNLKEVVTEERVYVSRGYNMALKMSTNPYFVFLHDDTFIHKDFLHNLVPHLNSSTICNFTTIEPPLFGNRDIFERPIQNFGFDLTDLNLDAFDTFCDNRNSKIINTVVDNPYGGFFMAGSIKTILSIGGFDERFKPFFYEDADLMLRLHLNGIRFVQVLNSLVYHLVSLTSRKSEDGNSASYQTERIFLNKWKSSFQVLKEYTMKNGTEYRPIRLRVISKNTDQTLQSFLSNLSDEDNGLPASLLHIDGEKFTNADLDYIHLLPYIIHQNVQQKETKFQLNNMILEIHPESILEPQIVANTL